METITIKVNADIARTYQAANPERQQKIQGLMSMLQMTKAEANGLAPEILQPILDE